MKFSFFLIFLVFSSFVCAEQKKDSFYDPTVDYSRFPGRVTDKDESGMVLKITSENKNIKFFKVGDFLEFHVAQHEKSKRCTAHIRNVEEDFITIFVKDIGSCWKRGDYFRRGTILSFLSPTLAQRVKDAAIFRTTLLQRKDDFLNQLSGINHFIWSYEQKKIQLASEYDKKMLEVEKQKQEALQELVVKKTDSLRLQQDLMGKLDGIDRDLDFFRVEKNELLIDRWHLDQDLSLPVKNRP